LHIVLLISVVVNGSNEIATLQHVLAVQHPVFLYTQLPELEVPKDDVEQRASRYSPPSQPWSYTPEQIGFAEHASCAEGKVEYDPVLSLQYVLGVFGYVHPAFTHGTNARPTIADRTCNKHRRCKERARALYAHKPPPARSTEEIKAATIDRTVEPK
jgi:hypothetical protein